MTLIYVNNNNFQHFTSIMNSGSGVTTIVILRCFLSAPTKGNTIYIYHYIVNLHRLQCSHYYVVTDRLSEDGNINYMFKVKVANVLWAIPLHTHTNLLACTVVALAKPASLKDLAYQ